MRRSGGSRAALAAAAWLGLGIGPARADVITLDFGNLTVGAGSPQAFSFPSIPAGTAFGFNLNGAFAQASGNPTPTAAVRVALTNPSNVTVSPGPLTPSTATSFTFPGVPFNATGTNNGSYLYRTGTPSAGTWQVQVSNAMSGTSYSLSNANISLYTSTSAIPALIYSGTNAGGPTFNRPNEDGQGLSGSTTNYSAQAFTVGASGRYMLGAAYGGGLEGFLLLYQGSFNPASPLANLIGADDDGFLTTPNTANGTSELTAPLTAGTTYIAVTTAFPINNTGTFTNFIVGPGLVTAVPEPGTLLLTGAAGVGAWVVRRRRKVVPARLQ